MEPTFPFDIEEATFLAPNLRRAVTTEELIASRARALERRTEDIEEMRQQIWRRRRELAGVKAERHRNIIRDYDFQRGQLVLVRNSGAEGGLQNKYKPRYLGPYIIIRRTEGGGYRLAEMDGTESELRFAARRLIPYHLRDRNHLPESNTKLAEANPPLNAGRRDNKSMAESISDEDDSNED